MDEFKLVDQGSIVLLQPLTVKAMEWIAETKPEDAQMWGTALVIEPRYVDGVVEAAQMAGFDVEGR